MNTNAPKLNIREIQASDVEQIIHYFFDSLPSDIERMGIDPLRMVDRDTVRSGL